MRGWIAGALAVGALGCTDETGGLVAEPVSDAGVVVDAGLERPPPGWDDPPGTGRTFVVADFGDAAPQSPFTPRFDPILDPLSPRQLEVRVAFELAGWDARAEAGGAFTVKVYLVEDANGDPSDDFESLTADPTCCEHVIRAQSLQAGQARLRFPAREVDGVVEAAGAAPILLEHRVDLRRRETLVAQARRWRLEVPDTPRPFWGDVELLLPAPELAASTYECATCESGMPRADRFAAALARFGQPEVDADGDGLECAFDEDGDGLVDRCTTGALDRVCGGESVPSEGDTSCVLQAPLHDGYVGAIRLWSVPARLRR